MHGVSFKKRAPRAIKEIRGFAVKAMVSPSSPIPPSPPTLQPRNVHADAYFV